MPARTLWQVLEMLRESRGHHCLECFLSFGPSKPSPALQPPPDLALDLSQPWK